MTFELQWRTANPKCPALILAHDGFVLFYILPDGRHPGFGSVDGIEGLAVAGLLLEAGLDLGLGVLDGDRVVALCRQDIRQLRSLTH